MPPPEEAIGTKIELLSGRREAELSALGVLSAIYKPDGIVGDLGGGSLELIKVKRSRIGKGASLPLGGLALMDASNKSPRQAAKIVREAIGDTKALKSLSGRTFYAVGGTWRALARLHMRQRNYPLNIMHNYTIPVRDAVDFLGLIERIDSDNARCDRGNFHRAAAAAGLRCGRSRRDHPQVEAEGNRDLRCRGA